MWGALIAVEAGLGVAVAAGIDAAAYAAAVLLARLRGRAGRRAGDRTRRRAVRVLRRARAGVARLARPRAAARRRARRRCRCCRAREPSTEGWLAIGLGAALIGLVALGVAVLALAREVGMLRLALDPRGALEIAHEGPEVGARSALADALRRRCAPGRIALAVFSSEGCADVPRARARGRRASAATRASCCATFDEVRDADAWAAADVPGSPFAVALDADGTVLAKGTFNTAAPAGVGAGGRRAAARRR